MAQIIHSSTNRTRDPIFLPPNDWSLLYTSYYSNSDIPICYLLYFPALQHRHPPHEPNHHGTITMLQQDLLDTLFLNRKALADTASTSAHPSANGDTRPTSTLAMTDAASTGGASADVCPVDHKSREAWLNQAQAAAAHDAEQQQQTPSHPAPPSSSSTAAAADACPVDHKSREAWLKQAQSVAAHDAPQSPQPPRSTPSIPQHSTASSASGWGWRIPFFSTPSTQSAPAATTTTTPPPSSKAAPTNALGALGQNRQVSTIPRSTAPGALFDAARPSNHESETGADARTGNWVYPSEKMFFDAMKRKGHDTRVADMKTVVPIHNAVNERAWVEIKEWERPYQGNA